MTEAETTKEIRKMLKLLNIFHWKQWQGPMSQPRGVSDILGIYKDKERMEKLGRIQYLAGKAKGIYMNDRDMFLADKLIPCLDEVFNLAVEMNEKPIVFPLAIEVKNEKAKLTKDQAFFLECWKSEGGIAIVARSAWDVVKALGLEGKFK